MIYKGTPTRGDYDAAQLALDLHVTSSSTGRCIECHSYGPCIQREAAISMMCRYMWLPIRTPGASQPELIGARRVC